jgi:hypothetical protein
MEEAIQVILWMEAGPAFETLCNKPSTPKKEHYFSNHRRVN